MLYSESAAELATMMTTVHNTTDFSSLHQAARNGDAHALRRLIEIVDPAAAAKIDSVLRSQKEWTVQKSNRTVSIKAAKQVQRAKDQSLFVRTKRRRRVDNKDKESATRPARPLVKLLQTKDSKRRTPLYVACAAGNADIAGALLAIGAGVNGHGAWQNTPLHIAAFEGHIAALRTLLGAGADLWALNDRGQTPSEVNAVYNGSRKVQTLFEEAREMRHLIAADLAAAIGMEVIHEDGERGTVINIVEEGQFTLQIELDQHIMSNGPKIKIFLPVSSQGPSTRIDPRSPPRSTVDGMSSDKSRSRNCPTCTGATIPWSVEALARMRLESDELIRVEGIVGAKASTQFGTGIVVAVQCSDLRFGLETTAADTAVGIIERDQRKIRDTHVAEIASFGTRILDFSSGYPCAYGHGTVDDSSFVGSRGQQGQQSPNVDEYTIETLKNGFTDDGVKESSSGHNNLAETIVHGWTTVEARPKNSRREAMDGEPSTEGHVTMSAGDVHVDEARCSNSGEEDEGVIADHDGGSHVSGGKTGEECGSIGVRGRGRHGKESKLNEDNDLPRSSNHSEYQRDCSESSGVACNGPLPAERRVHFFSDGLVPAYTLEGIIALEKLPLSARTRRSHIVGRRHRHLEESRSARPYQTSGPMWLTSSASLDAIQLCGPVPKGSCVKKSSDTTCTNVYCVGRGNGATDGRPGVNVAGGGSGLVDEGGKAEEEGERQHVRLLQATKQAVDEALVLWSSKADLLQARLVLLRSVASPQPTASYLEHNGNTTADNERSLERAVADRTSFRETGERPARSHVSTLETNSTTLHRKHGWSASHTNSISRDGKCAEQRQNGGGPSTSKREAWMVFNLEACLVHMTALRDWRLHLDRVLLQLDPCKEEGEGHGRLQWLTDCGP